MTCVEPASERDLIVYKTLQLKTHVMCKKWTDL